MGMHVCASVMCLCVYNHVCTCECASIVLHVFVKGWKGGERGKRGVIRGEGMNGREGGREGGRQEGE